MSLRFSLKEFSTLPFCMSEAKILSLLHHLLSHVLKKADRFSSKDKKVIDMGSCVSVHRNPDSAMEHRLSIASKADKLVITSPTKDKVAKGEHPIGEFGSKSQSSTQPPPSTSVRDFGSKEETFFDSQLWLESDCEDDFVSVNGDFTPSRSNTPTHQSRFIGTPQLNKSLVMHEVAESKPESSPTDKKKKLAELFCDDFGDDQVADDQNIAGNQNIANGKLEPKPTDLEIPLKSTNGAPCRSGANSICSGERALNNVSEPNKEKSERSSQCCFPSLVQSHSFSERKKRLNPGSIGGG